MRLLVPLLSVLFFSACFQTEVSLTNPEDNIGTQDQKVILNVKVTVCETVGGDICDPEPVIAAMVQLYHTEDEAMTRSDVKFSKESNTNGDARFEGLDERTYYVIVDCAFGEVLVQSETKAGKTNIVTIEF